MHLSLFNVPRAHFQWSPHCNSFSGCVCMFICSVISDSLWLHGLQPAGLLCPWDSPGKKTWVVKPCPASGDLSDLGTKCASLKSPVLAGGFITTSATREAHVSFKSITIPYFRRIVSGVPFILPSGIWDLSSLIRGQSHVPCIARQSLNPWNTREVHGLPLLTSKADQEDIFHFSFRGNPNSAACPSGSCAVWP